MNEFRSEVGERSGHTFTHVYLMRTFALLGTASPLDRVSDPRAVALSGPKLGQLVPGVAAVILALTAFDNKKEKDKGKRGEEKRARVKWERVQCKGNDTLTKSGNK